MVFCRHIIDFHHTQCVYLKTFGVVGTVSVNLGLILGTFLAVGWPSELLDIVEHVDALEQVDKFLRRADFLSGSFFSCFLTRRGTVNNLEVKLQKKQQHNAGSLLKVGLKCI